MKKNMTDEEALKEIDRQEKRFAAAKCGRGELIKNQEHKARLMFVEKVKRLAAMPVE